jgi:hypothetical protein
LPKRKDFDCGVASKTRITARMERMNSGTNSPFYHGVTLPRQFADRRSKLLIPERNEVLSTYTKKSCLEGPDPLLLRQVVARCGPISEAYGAISRGGEPS